MSCLIILSIQHFILTKLVIFIKQIAVNHCSKKPIFLHYIFECIQLVVDNCFILQVLYLSYTSYFYTLCLLFISDCDSSSLNEVNFLLQQTVLLDSRQTLDL